MANERLAEQTSFENQMSAFQNRRYERQTRRKAIQEELQDLDKEDETDNNKAVQLQSEYHDVTEQWERTQQTFQAQVLAAISPQMVRIHLQYLAALISV